MRVLDPGHVYILDSLDGDAPQTIAFVKREGARYPGNVGSHPGITVQEILRACMDRLEYVNEQIPCYETQAASGLLAAAALMLEVRAKRVKGKVLEADSIGHALALPICATCGHIDCIETHANQSAPRASSAEPKA